MDDLEDKLDTWGREWRASQPLIALPDVREIEKAQPVWLRRAWTLGLGVAAVTLLVFAAGRLPYLGTVGSPMSSPGSLAAIQVGDEVVASGNVIQDVDGRVTVCLAPASLAVDTGSAVPSCSRQVVGLMGLTVASVPGWQSDGSRGFAENVTVYGRWNGSAIEVSVVKPGLIGHEDIPLAQNPCPEVQGLRPDQETIDVEAAAGRLGDEVRAHDDLYGGIWRASASGGAAILVVAVVGDPSEARTRLSELYPYPLCFVSVQRSSADLVALAQRLATDNPDWHTEVEPSVNRVHVLVPVVDAPTWSRLEPQIDAIVVSPLVRLAR